jgi:hypothetical protein
LEICLHFASTNSRTAAKAVRSPGGSQLPKLLRHRKRPRSSTVSLHDLVGALQLVLASVAGQAPYRAGHGVPAAPEIRHTVIRVIAAQLREDAAVAWRDMHLDFTGAVLTAEASRTARSPAERSASATPSSPAARWPSSALCSLAARSVSTAPSSGAVFFNATVFSGGNVYFYSAGFSGGLVNSGTRVDFSGSADWSHPPTFRREDTPPRRAPAAGQARQHRHACSRCASTAEPGRTIACPLEGRGRRSGYPARDIPPRSVRRRSHCRLGPVDGKVRQLEPVLGLIRARRELMSRRRPGTGARPAGLPAWVRRRGRVVRGCSGCVAGRG